MAITYNNLTLDLRQKLRKMGVDSASLEAREIVCCGSGKTPEELLRDGYLYVPQHIEKEIQLLIDRRLQGEPVAYLLGEWEFYGIPFDITEDVLIPRTDTEVLVKEALPYIQEKGECRVLDLCTGSGCIGIAVAKNAEKSHIVMGDISDGALRVCRQNIRRNNLGGRALSFHMNALEKPPKTIGDFDFVLCNPPYITPKDMEQLEDSVKNYEPDLALRGLEEDGLGFYRIICEKWRDCMASGAMLFFEVGIGQADAVLRIMTQNGFGEGIIVEDTAGIPRVVYGKKYESI